MTIQKILSDLEKCGTIQNCRVYHRHGETNCQTPEAIPYIETPGNEKKQPQPTR